MDIETIRKVYYLSVSWKMHHDIFIENVDISDERIRELFSELLPSAAASSPSGTAAQARNDVTG